MNELTVPSPNLTVAAGKIWASSQDVAHAFGKRHDLLLRDLDRMMADLPSDFCLLNFEETEQNRPSPMVLGAVIRSRAIRMTRDGFTLLVMGFTGAQAMRFKILWLEAFNRMEEELARGSGQREALLVMELLRTNPLWADIRRYTLMGLKQKEICKLVDRCKDTVRAHTRRLRELGLLEAGTQTRKTRQLPLFGEVAR